MFIGYIQVVHPAHVNGKDAIQTVATELSCLSEVIGSTIRTIEFAKKAYITVARFVSHYEEVAVSALLGFTNQEQLLRASSKISLGYADGLPDFVSVYQYDFIRIENRMDGRTASLVNGTYIKLWFAQTHDNDRHEYEEIKACYDWVDMCSPKGAGEGPTIVLTDEATVTASGDVKHKRVDGVICKYNPEGDRRTVRLEINEKNYNLLMLWLSVLGAHGTEVECYNGRYVIDITHSSSIMVNQLIYTRVLE